MAKVYRRPEPTRLARQGLSIRASREEHDSLLRPFHSAVFSLL